MSNLNKILQVENNLYVTGELQNPKTIYDRMKYYRTPATSIAIVDQGKLSWTKIYGSDNSNSLFQVGSISKMINALGILKLVQENLLDLDKDINNYLQSWKLADNQFTITEKVTLRRLLSHSAGTNVHGFIGYNNNLYIPSTVEILEGKKPEVNTDKIEVIDIPGVKFRYSGGGTTITQLVIEEVTGKKYEDWMEENILLPLDMTKSSFKQNINETNIMYGYSADSKKVDGGFYKHPEMAAAGLWTTSTDLANCMIKLFNILYDDEQQFLDKKLLEEFLTPQIELIEEISNTINGATGLGFFINGTDNDFRFSHDGQNEGYVARFVAYPKGKKGFIVMANNDEAFDLIDEISISIARTYEIPGFDTK